MHEQGISERSEDWVLVKPSPLFLYFCTLASSVVHEQGMSERSEDWVLAKPSPLFLFHVDR